MNDPSVRSLAIVGGGISGLSAAYRVKQLRPSVRVTIYDTRPRLGGVIDTSCRDGFLVERSADMFTTREPWALDLCEDIGLSDELIGTNPQFRRAFVIFRGRLVPVPAGFTLMSPARIWPILRTPLLSWAGKIRLASEYFRGRKQDDADESLADFAVRRFGREAYQRLIQPLIGGIYTADPHKLSMNATMSQFVEMEREHGSLIRGMRAQGKNSTASGTSGARYGMFVAPRNGLRQLVERLQQKLADTTIRTATEVQKLTYADDQWQVAGEGFCDKFDAVVVAAPSFAAGRLLSGNDESLGSQLKAIPYASAALVVVAFKREQIAHQLNGFGFVAPQIEQRKILAGSFSSVKFAGRAPDAHVLIRVFVGGAMQGELVELEDKPLQQLVVSELRQLLTITGEPMWIELNRWRKTMPQYHVGHLERVAQIEKLAARLPRLALAGNAYRGVGIPFCVRSGTVAAESVLDAGQGS